MRNVIFESVNNEIKEVSLDKLNELTTRPFTKEEALKYFYKFETYEKYLESRSLATNTAKRLEEEIKRFYKNLGTVKQGRATLYTVDELINLDGTPENRSIRKKGRKKSSFRAVMEAIILLSLKHKLNKQPDMPKSRWLIELGIFSSTYVQDYKEYQKQRDNQEFLLFFFRKYRLPILIEDMHSKEGRRFLSKGEMRSILDNYFSVYEYMSTMFDACLNNLDKYKMIEHIDHIRYGVNQDIHYQLTIAETEKYVRKVTCLRKKYGYEGSNARNAFSDKDFVKELNNWLSKGIRCKDKNGKQTARKFEYTYKTKAIIKSHTTNELKKYLDKNKEVKEMFNYCEEDLVNRHRDEKTKLLASNYINNYNKLISSIESCYDEEIERIKKNAIGNNQVFLEQAAQNKERSLLVKDEIVNIGDETQKLLNTAHSDKLSYVLNNQNTEPILQHLTFE